MLKFLETEDYKIVIRQIKGKIDVKYSILSEIYTKMTGVFEQFLF